MRIGYARVSTDDQTLDMHRVALRRRKLSVKTIRSMLKSGDIPVSTVAEKFRVARSTLYRNIGANP